MNCKEPITCTVKRNGYERQCSRRLKLTGIRSLEVPGPGAVAHMSLHQKPTMSKSHPTKEADSDGTPICVPGDLLSDLCWRPKRTEPVETGRAASVKGHIWTALSRVNAFLQFNFARRWKPPKPLFLIWILRPGFQGPTPRRQVRSPSARPWLRVRTAAASARALPDAARGRCVLPCRRATRPSRPGGLRSRPCAALRRSAPRRAARRGRRRNCRPAREPRLICIVSPEFPCPRNCRNWCPLCPRNWGPRDCLCPRNCPELFCGKGQGGADSIFDQIRGPRPLGLQLS